VEAHVCSWDYSVSISRPQDPGNIKCVDNGERGRSCEPLITFFLNGEGFTNGLSTGRTGTIAVDHPQYSYDGQGERSRLSNQRWREPDHWCSTQQLQIEGAIRKALADFRFEKAEQILAGNFTAVATPALSGDNPTAPAPTDAAATTGAAATGAATINVELGISGPPALDHMHCMALSASRRAAKSMCSFAQDMSQYRVGVGIECVDRSATWSAAMQACDDEEGEWEAFSRSTHSSDDQSLTGNILLGSSACEETQGNGSALPSLPCPRGYVSTGSPRTLFSSVEAGGKSVCVTIQTEQCKCGTTDASGCPAACASLVPHKQISAIPFKAGVISRFKTVERGMFQAMFEGYAQTQPNSTALEIAVADAIKAKYTEFITRRTNEAATVTATCRL